jgi:coiled-coil domain-containing protein 55
MLCGPLSESPNATRKRIASDSIADLEAMSFSMKLPAAKGKKKQYGLILPTSSSSSSSNKPSAGFNAFAASSGSSSKPPSADKAAVRRKVGEEAARSFQKTQAELEHAKALAEDPSVFDYDGVYDELQSARAAKRGEQEQVREADKKRPKYITTLLEAAKIREVENERIRERRLLNERKAEDALYGDKEKLVSASYKRKLVEMKRWEDEDKRLDALEAANDVTKQGEHALAGFYANLMTRNIAMGGDAAHASSKYTAGRGREDDERKPKRSKADEEDPRAASGDRKDERGTESDGQRRARSDSREYHDERRARQEDQPPSQESSERGSAEPSKPVATRVAETEAEPKPSKEDSIAAARARFLARKAQRSAAS